MTDSTQRKNRWTRTLAPVPSVRRGHIFESFSALRNDLGQERRAMQRIWAKREKQIDRVLTNTVSLHGDVAASSAGARRRSRPSS